MGFDDVRGVMTRWAGMKCDLGAGVRWWKVAMLNGFFPDISCLLCPTVHRVFFKAPFTSSSTEG